METPAWDNLTQQQLTALFRAAEKTWMHNPHYDEDEGEDCCNCCDGRDREENDWEFVHEDGCPVLVLDDIFRDLQEEGRRAQLAREPYPPLRRAAPNPARELPTGAKFPARQEEFRF